MDELTGVWRTPIRQLQISVNPRAIPEESMLELRFSLEHDNLFTAPACFFFARLREGRTWPPEARFEEPSPGDFRFGQARPDAKMRWIDRVVSPGQSLYAPRFRHDPASFRLELDGSDWRPGELEPRRTYEFPPLAELVANRASFSLTLHDVAAGTARTVDPEKTDLDVTVTVSVPGEIPHRPVTLRLFSPASRRRATDRVGRRASSARDDSVTEKSTTTSTAVTRRASPCSTPRSSVAEGRRRRRIGN